MKKNSQLRQIILICASVVILSPSISFADEDDATVEATDKNDKTGTNPINFQRDIRFYNEYQWLDTEGDGNQNIITNEFRTPFAGGKWQFRSRIRYAGIEADLNDDGNDDIDENGFGDADFRLLTVPYLKGRNAFAYALEVFLDTASEDVLGAGTTSLGPQAFYVRFFPRGLFAPGLQYKFSIDEDSGRDDTDQILIDLNLLILAKNKLSWFFTDPQIVIDNENNEEFALIDLEYGWMMQRWFPEAKGQSVYIRPSFSVGADRPTDASLEIGYKIVGW
jgi:hypothetical protein